MSAAKTRRIERIEHYLVDIIQQKGADKGRPFYIKMLLFFLWLVSLLFHAVVSIRYVLYELGILRRFPLGCQVISVGNVTAGGTGKTPVVEKFAKELQAAGRKVAILSRGYRKKELPWYQRIFRQVVDPPRIVSDGKHLRLDSEMGGDEPYMLASNLPGVCVLVDKDRVKSGRYAIKHFRCDTLILDDGFQYQKLRHTLEVCLVDKTNPIGNGHLLPRGILRESAKNIRRADFIFITKSDSQSAEVRKLVRKYNKTAEIIECRHAPRFLKDVYSRDELPLSWLKDKKLATLSGIAVPQGFENSLRHLGARVVRCKRYADHHRYSASEIIETMNKAADCGCDALVTTEKDAVRFPRFETTPLPVLYLRVDIEILSGAENFREAVSRICHAKPRETR